MFSKLKKGGAVLVAGIASALPFVSSAAVDLTEFDNALATGTEATRDMVSTFGLKGILIVIAVISAGVVIYFVKWGAHKGVKAMNGRF